MSHRFTSLAVAVLAGALALPAQAKPTYQQPGLWQITMDVERDGVRVNSKPIEKKRCVSAAESAEPEKHLFQPFEQGCTSTHQDSDHKVKWSYECPGLTPSKGHGEMSWSKDSYSGTSENLAELGGKLKMSKTIIRFSGKHLGECPKVEQLPKAKAPKVPPPSERKEAPPSRA